MAETLYGTHDESHSIVMSERVQTLASSIYREFECMIGTYGDSVINGLMPHIVSILENLNQAYREKQDHEVEIELLRVENDNLKKQFEKEKQLRKNSEQKYLEGDDLLEEEKKLHRQAIETMESNLRRLEVKGKNLQEQILRNEERETEMKNEYSKLHSRYTEIFKTHADYVERYKLHMEKEVTSPSRSGMPFPVLKRVENSVICTSLKLKQPNDVKDGQDEIFVAKNKQSESAQCNNQDIRTESETPLPDENDKKIGQSNQLPESVSEPSDQRDSNASVVGLASTDFSGETQIASTKDSPDGTTAIPNRLNISWTGEDEGGGEWAPEEGQDASVDECLLPSYGGNILSLTSVDFDESGEGLRDDNQSPPFQNSGARLHNMSIYDELSQQDSKALVEMDGGINLAGVTAEVEKLIKENNELLETKNALNVVKDDLITKVDELLGEHELLREELCVLQKTCDKHVARIAELEDDVKRLKEELEELRAKAVVQDEDAEKKCFTRIDMARVVMERNQFKEKLMELQEAMRLAEMLRASRDHPDLLKGAKKEKKSSLWNFFSGLVSSSDVTPQQTPKKPNTPTPLSKPPTVI